MVLLYKFSVKTGGEGWELYIPIYSYYVLYKVAGLKSYWFTLYLILSVFLVIFSGNFIICALIYLFLIVLHYYYCLSLAKKFNKGIGFALGLFFLNFIFMAILTFSKKCIYNK
jgi:hypothetical protein